MSKKSSNNQQNESAILEQKLPENQQEPLEENISEEINIEGKPEVTRELPMPVTKQNARHELPFNRASIALKRPAPMVSKGLLGEIENAIKKAELNGETELAMALHQLSNSLGTLQMRLKEVEKKSSDEIVNRLKALFN